MSESEEVKVIEEREYEYVLGVCRYDEFAIPEPGTYRLVRVKDE